MFYKFCNDHGYEIKYNEEFKCRSVVLLCVDENTYLLNKAVIICDNDNV